THQQMKLELSSKGRVVQHQSIEVVTKMEHGQLRALARFTAPEDLRDTALLVMEQQGRPDDYFLYLPALDKVRRVAGAQRRDSFRGTDLTYEDLERRRVDDFEDLRARPEQVAGEPVLAVSARPREAAGYERVEFAVATADAALLETRYYARRSETPFKVISFPRARVREQDGVSIATRIHVSDRRRHPEPRAPVESPKLTPPLAPRLSTTTPPQRGAPPTRKGARGKWRGGATSPALR